MENFIMSLVSAQELQDWQQTLIKILLTVLLAGLIGLERENRGRPAGLRTHILVSLGATLLMIVSGYLAEEFQQAGASVWLDRGRIAAGIVTGVGFLGAGTIVRNGLHQRGLTTAAMVWFAACLGVAIGSGFYLVSILSTFVVLFVVRGLGALENRLAGREHVLLMLELRDRDQDLAQVHARVLSTGCAFAQLNRARVQPQSGTVILEFQVELQRGKRLSELLEAMRTVFAHAHSVELRR